MIPYDYTLKMEIGDVANNTITDTLELPACTD
jgi:hypothetical protein